MLSTLKKLNNYSDIIGRENLKKHFLSLARSASDRVFIINAPQGSDKELWAKALSYNILCQYPDDKGACQTCKVCKYILAGTNPDYQEILLETASKNIPVDEIRVKIHAEIYLSPQFGTKKLWYIDGNGLSEIDQNALLKVLEEPPSYAYFVICIDDKTTLLPTLRSRAIELDIPALNNEELELLFDINDVQDVVRRNLASSFSSGLPLLALDLVNDQEFLEKRSEIFQWFSGFLFHNAAEVLTTDYAFWESYKDNIEHVLLFLQSFIRDLSILSFKSSNDDSVRLKRSATVKLMNADFEHELMILTENKGFTVTVLAEVLKILNDLNKRLKANANFEMSVCSALLRIRTILA